MKNDNIDHKIFMSIPSCPACDNNRYVEFNWKYALNNPETRIGKYPKYILKVKGLKFGSLYGCTICKASWWLNAKNLKMHLIKNHRLYLLEEWNRKKHLLPMALSFKAYRIGRTPIDIYGNLSEYIVIPCAITTMDGNYFAKSIIKITQLPPLFENPERVAFVDEIKKIMPSSFALPLIVRKATALAEETHMCFSPTVVQSGNEKKFILNGIQNFFDYNGTKGEDIELLANTNIEKKPIFYEDKHNDVHYFYGDIRWYQKLFL